MWLKCTTFVLAINLRRFLHSRKHPAISYNSVWAGLILVGINISSKPKVKTWTSFAYLVNVNGGKGGTCNGAGKHFRYRLRMSVRTHFDGVKESWAKLTCRQGHPCFKQVTHCRQVESLRKHVEELRTSCKILSKDLKRTKKIEANCSNFYASNDIPGPLFPGLSRSRVHPIASLPCVTNLAIGGADFFEGSETRRCEQARCLHYR